MSDSADPLRAQLVRVLDWEEAHVGFKKAVDGISLTHRGATPAGFEHSPWQLVEHLRIAQKDLLDFCVNARYVHTMKWPDDYWPAQPAPPTDEAWTKSLADFEADRNRLKDLVRDDAVDLFAKVPTGKDGQTCLRTVMLVIDHNAYHVGQLVAVRRALGIWR